VTEPEPGPVGVQREDMDLVIVTGVSGGGRSTVARALENIGYYVVDNLPLALVSTVAEMAFATGGSARRTALVLDVRSGAFTGGAVVGGLAGVESDLRERGYRPRVVFLDAADDVLVRRFESVRRKHPLQGDGRLADGIAAERHLLGSAREFADVVIDTSQLNVNQLRARIEQSFATAPRGPRFTVMSFGYKYGLPVDADLVLDLRWLPNPHWVPELRPLTGLDPEVSDYILSQPKARDLLDRYAAILCDIAGGFEREGKQYVTVAVGCTGGKHRSVATAEALAARLRQGRLDAGTVHRDLGRE
jgi:UPF0042 nucleotide-binding protein